jgi:hypothetical protein
MYLKEIKKKTFLRDLHTGVLSFDFIYILER